MRRWTVDGMVDSGPWTVDRGWAYGRMGVWACERVDVLYCTVRVDV